MVDPCEKNPVDTLTPMGEQQREDITSSAQVQALELYINYQADCDMNKLIWKLP